MTAANPGRAGHETAAHLITALTRQTDYRQRGPGRDHAVRHLNGSLVGWYTAGHAARLQRDLHAHGFAVTICPPQAEREAG